MSINPATRSPENELVNRLKDAERNINELASRVFGTAAGVGTVTSVGLSGGTTGLTVSGSPVTAAGTITLAGTLDLDNGGTGATTATGARTALGLVIGTDVQAYSANAAFRTDKLSAFAATTSTELAGVISDETGSDALVFGTSPTIVTPTIASLTNAQHNHQNAAGGGTLDHGLALTGLTDDDHTQYFLGLGRATPQTGAFGTASGAATGYLTSTSHATKGKYFLNAAGTMTVDEANVYLGVGTDTPGAPLHAVGAVGTGSTLLSKNTSASGPTTGGRIATSSDDGAAMASGDRLGAFTFGGSYDGSGTTVSGVGVRAYATELWSASAIGSKLVFFTTPNTTLTNTERLTIGQDGAVTIANLGTGLVHSSSAGLLTSTAVNLASADVTGVLPVANYATGTPDGTKFVRDDGVLSTPAGAGDVASDTATSVDAEIALFKSTTGKLIKRATGTGIAKVTSGVLGVATSADLPAGAVVQTVTASFSAVATGTTVLPADDTIPQNTEGDEYITLAITPKSTTNRLIIEAVIMFSSSVGNNLTAALFQDTTANALAAVDQFQATGTAMMTMPIGYEMAAGTTSATTFKVRAGGSAAGTTTFNGQAAARRFGAITKSYVKITEVKV